jgi:hypothetical protein
MTTALTTIPAPNPSYVFATGVPFIGTVDLKSPIEWIWIGALAADLIMVKGLSKWIIAAGIVVARYEVQKRSQS